MNTGEGAAPAPAPAPAAAPVAPTVTPAAPTAAAVSPAESPAAPSAPEPSSSSSSAAAAAAEPEPEPEPAVTSTSPAPAPSPPNAVAAPPSASVAAPPAPTAAAAPAVAPAPLQQPSQVPARSSNDTIATDSTRKLEVSQLSSSTSPSNATLGKKGEKPRSGSTPRKETSVSGSAATTPVSGKKEDQGKNDKGQDSKEGPGKQGKQGRQGQRQGGEEKEKKSKRRMPPLPGALSSIVHFPGTLHSQLASTQNSNAIHQAFSGRSDRYPRPFLEPKLAALIESYDSKNCGPFSDTLVDLKRRKIECEEEDAAEEASFKRRADHLQMVAKRCSKALEYARDAEPGQGIRYIEHALQYIKSEREQH